VNNDFGTNISREEARGIGLAVLTAALVAMAQGIAQLGVGEIQRWREERRTKKNEEESK
jgi:hypothetical protein